MISSRRTWFLLFTSTVILGAGLLAATQKSPQQAEVLLESAKQKELVDGKLQEAIQIYQRIVQEYSANRPIAAKALLGMGQCYEKLGQADARKAYERLVRDFGDQAESVTEARARLAALALPAAAKKPELAARLVWANANDLTGSPSSDGRLMATTDWMTGDIAIRDLATGEERRVTKTGDIMKTTVFGFRAKFSPDDQQIAYAWLSSPAYGKQKFDLWLVGADGTGVRLLYREEKAGYVLPVCWTPDGKSIVAIVDMSQGDKSRQIVLVSAESGAVRVLKSSSQSDPHNISVSPDGRFLVYDVPQAEGKHDIFVMSLQDARETRLVDHPADDREPIWTPDGQRVLFVSDRTGAPGLWAQEVADGKALASPDLVRPGMGVISPMRFTKSGALYYGLATEVFDVFVATLDPTAGRFADKPSPVSQQIVAVRSRPSWSPDGRYLAFLSQRDPAPPGSTVTIRAVDTGEERDVHVDVAPVRQLSWSPDGAALIIPGLDLERKPGVFRLDLKSGTVSAIVTRQDLPIAQAGVTLNGRSLVYFGYANDGQPVVVRDLATGAEKVLMRSAPRPTGMAVSPDGRSVAVTTEDEATGRNTVVVMQIAGGEAREIYRLDRAQSIRGFSGFPLWTPDGRQVMVGIRLQDQVEPFLVPVDGGEPVKIVLPRSGITHLSFHPDGRRVAFQVGQSRSEVWVIENFLPPLKR